MEEQKKPRGPGKGPRPLPPDIAGAPEKEAALKLLFDRWSPASCTETAPLAQAMGRVLAEDLRAKYDLPVVRASAMDGVAICYESVKGGVPDTAAWRVGKEFVRADTGDDFPDEYDTVVPIEKVELLPEGGLRFEAGLEIRPGQCVRPRGSNLHKGQLLVRAGTKLGVMDLAALGSGGYGSVPVMKKPQVAFLPTGSELVPIGSELKRGQNFDTNSLVAEQMLLEMGAQPVMQPLIRDEYAVLKENILRLAEENDVVIVNAGTSKGDEDYCPRVLEEIGQTLFHGVRAVPGRPMAIALVRGKPVVNLSGPSVAAFHGLEWAVKPIVARLLGTAAQPRETVTASLTAPLGGPPFLSRCVMMHIRKDEDGRYLAAPAEGGRPGPGGPPPVDLDAPMSANGVYISGYNERPREAGETIEVMLLRAKETIGS